MNIDGQTKPLNNVHGGLMVVPVWVVCHGGTRDLVCVSLKLLELDHGLVLKIWKNRPSLQSFPN